MTVTALLGRRILGIAAEEGRGGADPALCSQMTILRIAILEFWKQILICVLFLRKIILILGKIYLETQSLLMKVKPETGRNFALSSDN